VGKGSISHIRERNILLSEQSNYTRKEGGTTPVMAGDTARWERHVREKPLCRWTGQLKLGGGRLSSHLRGRKKGDWTRSPQEELAGRETERLYLSFFHRERGDGESTPG